MESAGVALEQAEAFTAAIIDLGGLRKRVVEQYVPDSRTLQQRVTVEMQMPQSVLTSQENGATRGRSRLLVPVILPPKGELLDNLVVYGNDDSLLDTLSYREYLSVAAGVLHMLLAVACDVLPSQLPEHVLRCEFYAIWGLVSRVDGRPDRDAARRGHALADTHCRDEGVTGPESADVPQAATSATAPPAEAGAATGPSPAEPPDVANGCPSARDIATRIQGLTEGIVNRQALRMAAYLAEILATHYAIVADVAVPDDGRFIIKYERTFIPDFRPAPHTRSKPRHNGASWLMRIGGILNVLFGTGPVDIRVSMDNAWTCQSYHAHVNCPPGLYLSHQELDVPDGYMDRKAKGAPTPPHVRFRRRLGQSYAHFYGRYLPMPREGEQRPKLILDFHEMPPGSVFGAALSAQAAAVLVWIIGFAVSHAPGHGLGTDAPVVLLAFPGVAASWLGFDTFSRRLFEGALTARLSLACTAVVSMMAAALYLLRNTPTATAHKPHSAAHTLALLGVSEVPWILLLVVALFNALYLTYRWLINSWRFSYFASRPDPGGVQGCSSAMPGRRDAERLDRDGAEVGVK